MSYESLVRAVEIAGSQSAFARETGISQQRLSGILKRRGFLPAEFVRPAEAAFGISRHELRSDIYPKHDVIVACNPLSEMQPAPNAPATISCPTCMGCGETSADETCPRCHGAGATPLTIPERAA